MNTDDRELLEEEKRIAREEKRRAAEQKRLEAESERRKQSARRYFGNVFTAVSSFFSKILAALIDFIGRIFPVAVKNSHAFFCNAAQRIRDIYTACSNAASNFASKAYSLPILISASFCIYYVMCYAKGIKLFALETAMPTFHFYLGDYSVGYCSRLFMGALTGLFKYKVSIKDMNAIVNIAACAAFIIESVIAGFMLKKSLKEKSVPALMIVLVFLFDPLIHMHNAAVPGLLDVYIFLLFLLWLPTLKTPLVFLTTPLVCLIGNAIHYEFFFTFMPPMLVLLMYYAANAKRKSQRICSGITLFTGGAVSASSFVWFVFLAKDHLKMTSDEFYSHMLSRFNITLSQRETFTKVMGAPFFRDYVDYYIFGQYKGEEYYNKPTDFLGFLTNWASEHFDPVMLRDCLILFVPAFILFAVIWICCIKKSKGITRFAYFCFLAQVSALIPELIISTDSWRWFSSTLIAQAIVFFTVYADERSVLHELMSKKTVKNDLINVGVWAVFVAYMGICLPIK